MKNATLIAIAIFFLSACGAKTVYVTTELPLPERPVFAKVTGAELECLVQPAYDRLETSIKQRNAHIETLENIIKTTHE